MESAPVRRKVVTTFGPQPAEKVDIAQVQTSELPVNLGDRSADSLDTSLSDNHDTLPANKLGTSSAKSSFAEPPGSDPGAHRLISDHGDSNETTSISTTESGGAEESLGNVGGTSTEDGDGDREERGHRVHSVQGENIAGAHRSPGAEDVGAGVATKTSANKLQTQMELSEGESDDQQKFGPDSNSNRENIYCYCNHSYSCGILRFAYM